MGHLGGPGPEPQEAAWAGVTAQGWDRGLRLAKLCYVYSRKRASQWEADPHPFPHRLLLNNPSRLFTEAGMSLSV